MSGEIEKTDAIEVLKEMTMDKYTRKEYLPVIWFLIALLEE